MQNRTSLIDTFGAALDGTIATQKRQRERQRAEHARQGEAVQTFVSRAENALKQAAAAINDRTEALGLSSPAVVEGNVALNQERSVSGSATVTTTRSARNGGRDDRTYSWSMCVSVHIDDGARTSTQFEIRAQRAGWWDAWGCDIPTEECNPAGLSITTSGEEVARRFMSWFTRYVA